MPPKFRKEDCNQFLLLEEQYSEVLAGKLGLSFKSECIRGYSWFRSGLLNTAVYNPRSTSSRSSSESVPV